MIIFPLLFRTYGRVRRLAPILAPAQQPGTVPPGGPPTVTTRAQFADPLPGPTRRKLECRPSRQGPAGGEWPRPQSPTCVTILLLLLGNAPGRRRARRANPGAASTPSTSGQSPLSQPSTTESTLGVFTRVGMHALVLCHVDRDQQTRSPLSSSESQRRGGPAN